MAEKKQSKLRYDDFVANVQPDPGKPVSTTMLSGFVGRGQEGHARIYPDPSLGTWYDVPEDDIVHSAPIADSKLGGSHVWIKADAQIKPGSAAATAAAAQPAVAITPQPTPATHCFICPPPHQTLATICTLPVVCQPHLTPATICTLHGVCLPPPTPHCTPGCPPPPPTPASMCIICPQNTAAPMCTVAGCFQDAGMLANPAARLAALPHTAATVCTQFGCPGPHTAATVCTQPLGCTFVGCTPHCPGGGPGGPFTPATLCTQHPPCPLPFTPATICPTVRCGVFNPFG